MSEQEYQMAVQERIVGISPVLRDLENEIKNIRKQLKTKQRKYELQRKRI